MSRLFTIFFFIIAFASTAQHFNLGLNFQFCPYRQVKVDADKVIGTYSHDLFFVKDNSWKVYSATYLLGLEVQMDYKKFYAMTGLYYNLNTFNYDFYFPVSPQEDEKVTFQTIYFQLDVPLAVGYQFFSSGIYRVSLLGGVIPSFPYNVSNNFVGSDANNNFYIRYSNVDMRNILFDGKPYVNEMFGLGLHIASLAKFDVRYQQRLGSPSDQYNVSYKTLGISLTFYLPLNLRKKNIFYEE
jgi:hypothetical protein